MCISVYILFSKGELGHHSSGFKAGLKSQHHALWVRLDGSNGGFWAEEMIAVGSVFS